MITWDIINLERDIVTGLVTKAYWRVSAASYTYIADCQGICELERSDTFIPYSELTEDQVITWIKSKIDVETIEAEATAKLEIKKNLTSQHGIPWVLPPAA